MCKCFTASGKFKDLSPKIRIKFHQFLTDLFASTNHDRQDQDAAGFYSWGGDRRAHEKIGVTPKGFTELSKKWESLKYNPSLLYICHARGAMGNSSNPINNHPFVGDNIALMHEGWISNHMDKATKRGLSLMTDTDSEFYMRVADQRRLSLGDRNEWSASTCLSAMLKITDEPTAIALIDHSSTHPHIWFGKNKAAGNHPFFFYQIKEFNGTFLTSTEEMMDIASYLAFDKPEKSVKKFPIDVEPFVVYKMDYQHSEITFER